MNFFNAQLPMSAASPSPPKKYSLKVILLGSAGVGKTSLVSCYFNNPFDSQSFPTVAPASCSATVRLDDNVQVELQIWDTAGQERFQSISKIFYRDSHVALICFDSTAIETIDTWVVKLREEVSDCILFLVATKVDLLNEEEISDFIRSAGEKQGEHGAHMVVLTSSVTSMGVKEVFTEVAKCVDQIYATNQPSVDLNAKEEEIPADGCC
jgi:small GTP-binding protein